MIEKVKKSDLDKFKRMGATKKKKVMPPNIDILGLDEYVKNTNENDIVAVYITDDGTSIYTNNKYYHMDNFPFNYKRKWVFCNVTEQLYKVNSIDDLYRDIYIGGNLIDENADTTLDGLCNTYLHKKAYNTNGVGDKYNVLNAEHIYNIYLEQEPLIKEQMDIYNMEIAFNKVLLDMQYNGIYIDIDKLSTIDKQYEDILEDLSKQYKDYIKQYDKKILSYNTLYPDKPFNYTIEDISILLFNILKYPSKSKSVSSDALEKIDKELARIISKYRSYTIYRNTIKNIYNSMDDNISHTHFHSLGAKTGRISCGNPINLQSVPKNEIRNVFIGGTTYKEVDKRKDNSYVVNECDEVQLQNEKWVFADELKSGDILITGEKVNKIIKKDYKVLIGL